MGQCGGVNGMGIKMLLKVGSIISLLLGKDRGAPWQGGGGGHMPSGPHHPRVEGGGW